MPHAVSPEHYQIIQATMNAPGGFDGHRLALLGRTLAAGARGAAPIVGVLANSSPATMAVQSILALLLTRQAPPPSAGILAPAQPPPQPDAAALEAMLAQIAGVALQGLLKPQA